MPIRVTQPGRTNAIRQTVAVPTSNTGAQITHNNPVIPLVRTRQTNAANLPLTTQRQGFTQPIKAQGFSR